MMQPNPMNTTPITNPFQLEIVLRAISFAARKHLGQVRKDGETPYLAHPLRVMTILAIDFGVRDHEILAAAVLHDTIEDTTTDRDELSEQFGERVARTVADLSKDKRLPEDERERAYFDQLANGPIEVKLCKLADMLDNLMDSVSLPGGQRVKSVARATELLRRFSPGWPAQWQHALDRIRELVERP
jgi:guanosine-3',5'-bis(diphosphate) 3'-pyrophosphohydrolase